MSVLLYSGGLDAYCINKIYSADRLLFVDPGTDEAAREWELMAKAATGPDRSQIEKIEMPFLSEFEDGNKIIPFRNTFFAMAGGLFAEYVMLGATNGDGVDTADTTRSWASSVEAMMNSYSDPTTKYRVDLPARNYTKADLVDQAVDSPGISFEDVLFDTKSCHYGTAAKGCGNCPGCLRRYVAFECHTDDSDLTTDEILEHFEKDPVVQGFEKNRQAVVNEFARRDKEYSDFVKAMENRGYDRDEYPQPSGGLR